MSSLLSESADASDDASLGVEDRTAALRSDVETALLGEVDPAEQLTNARHAAASAMDAATQAATLHFA